MDLALYHPDLGYYARAVQRSGRAGDFFTSVDVGPLFGELLAVQIAEMAGILARPESGARVRSTSSKPAPATAAWRPTSSARSHAIAPAALRRARACISSKRAPPRGTRSATTPRSDVADRLVASSAALPASFEGVLVANELLDAMPVHQVVMREDGLREIYVGRA